MKIEKIELSNFRQFYGTQELTFSSEKNTNVSVIHGENGHGKTAILNAFKWCLFEQTTDDFKQPKELLNYQAKEEGYASHG